MIFIRILFKTYWFRVRLIEFTKWYFFRYHIGDMLSRIEREGKEHLLHPSVKFYIDECIRSDPFKEGVINHLFLKNNYQINSKYIAVGLSIKPLLYSMEQLNVDEIIDISFYLYDELVKRINGDELLKYIFQTLGKEEVIDHNTYTREEIRDILNDKVLVFKTYFSIFVSKNHSDILKIYYPGYNKTYIEYNSIESLDIPICKYNLSRGIFLQGFDFFSQKKGFLNLAIERKGITYFNPKDFKYCKGKVLWMR